VRVCPTGALFEKGSRVTADGRDPDLIAYLKTAREKKRWIR
jgi:NADH dehydrogenase/NADH:ubiquinone oxidoreductase subunit G